MTIRQGGLRRMNRIISLYVNFRRQVMVVFSGTTICKSIFREVLCILLCVMSPSTLAIDHHEVFDEDKVFKPSDYFARPYPLDDLSQGIILVEIDQSRNMLERAYSSSPFDALSMDGKIGYFKPLSQYRYNEEHHYFEEDLTLQQGQKIAWDGQFLNWLLMRQIDMVRYFLLGVEGEFQERLQERAQESERQGKTESAKIINLDTSKHKLVIEDSRSRSYSPIPNTMPLSINSGQLKFQATTLQLRLKKQGSEKGLLDLLTNSVRLYFYAQKAVELHGRIRQKFIFDDSTKLLDYLRAWSADDSKVEHYKPALQREDQSSKLRQKALQEIKQLTLKNENNHKTLCQRYVHLSISSSPVNYPFLANSNVVADCQKDLVGDQELKHFQLLSSDETVSSSQNNFTFHETDKLMKSIFRALSSEREGDSFQMSGADMERFPDHSGVIYQSWFKYSLKGAKQEVNWLGDLRAALIDDQGRLRSDNGDRKLGSLHEDPLLSSCFDDMEKVLRFRFLTTPSAEGNCNALNYPYFEQNVGYLWRASSSLNNASQESINRQRVRFQSNGPKRYIRSHIGQTEYDFVEGGKENGRFPVKPEWLNVNTQKDADELINYVRGQDQEGFRTRYNDQDVFLLGDTANNSPIVVGKPASNYHLLYGDRSYQVFLKQYQNRRSRVFLGTNDGILHSFNAGWFDIKTKQLKNATETDSNWTLGQETWAFVPFSAFAYLSELSDKRYGISANHHLNFLKQKPFIFDAKLFSEYGLIGQADRPFYDHEGNQISQKTHPDGWGTLMVVGVSLGNSAYLVFDITDAEQAPKLLAELQVKNMGSAISLPSVMTLKNTQGVLEWKLVLGSGTDLDPASMVDLTTKHSAGIYIVNLKDIQSKQSHLQPRLIDLKESSSYVTGISSADWDLDGETDALYLNTASLIRNTGSLYRINPRNDFSKKIVLKSEKLLDVQAPLIDRPQLTLDNLGNRWMFLSTGISTGLSSDHGVQEQSVQITNVKRQRNKIIGLKEPRNSRGTFSVDTVQGSSVQVSLSSLVDVSNVLVSPESGKLEGSWSIQPKLKENIADELEKRLMQFSNSSAYLHGWLRYLDQNETSTDASTLFGGILTQASYQTEYQNCRVSGDAFIHRLRFTTGTSWYSKHRQTNRTNNQDPELKSTKSNSFGSKAITSILLNEGVENVSQIQSSEAGNTQTLLEDSRKLIQSGEVSWREL
jgi:hypothetical protein